MRLPYPLALFLLRGNRVQLRLQVITSRRYRRLPGEKIDGAFQLAAVPAQLERRQG
jgi:hypothetical protein